MLNEAYNYYETKGKEAKDKYPNMATMIKEKMPKGPEPVRRDLKLIDFNQTIDLGSPLVLDATKFKKMKQR